MCGIFFEICKAEGHCILDKDETLLECLKCRGPDYCSKLTHNHKVINATSHIFSSVLWMQGQTLVKQPLENELGSLIYNGDSFDWSHDSTESDTIYLFQEISDKQDDIIETIKSLKGPFSFVYLNKQTDKIYFSRDRFGRNSLLFHKSDGGFIISSALNRNYRATIEVPTTHIYEINLEMNTIKSYSWTKNEENEQDLTVWFHNIYNKQECLNDTQTSFQQTEISVDEKAQSLINCIEEVGKCTESKEEIFEKLLQNTTISSIVNSIIHLLKRSLEIRLTKHPQTCKNCIKTKTSCKNHCSVGILFSGGLDCSILALLADDFIPKDQPIDLLNVGFQLNESGSYDVPDRLTGRTAYAELKELRPDRKWQLIEINVGAHELERNQCETIAELVYPRRTILDESLGSALWFAARGFTEDYESTSRVLLVGSGADELFGGYTRHRNAFKRKSWQGLHHELLIDWHRLPHRNLARDNRVISYHGRQPRLPYLDEDFVEFVNGLKPWERCFPSLEYPPGLGEKLYLRLAAHRIGLKKHVAMFPKRAIQFGSRIANKKENGADVSVRFLNKS